jgi:hypothetical protein
MVAVVEEEVEWLLGWVADVRCTLNLLKADYCIKKDRILHSFTIELN